MNDQTNVEEAYDAYLQLVEADASEEDREAAYSAYLDAKHAPVMPWSILTNAPEDYDYGVTVKFSNPVLGTKGLRLVECYTEADLIERGEAPESARWRMEQQAMRYGSGLYLGLVEPSGQDYEWYKARY